MSRYDLATKKIKKKKAFVSAPDTIAEDIKNFGESNEEKGIQTPIRGKNLLIRGPNGFQISIPIRFTEIRFIDGEYWIRLTPSAARGLQEDFSIVQSNQTERLRLNNLARNFERWQLGRERSLNYEDKK
jgi:hypothetical protein